MFQTLVHSIVTFIDLVALSALAGIILCAVRQPLQSPDTEDSAFLSHRLYRLGMLCIGTLAISGIGDLMQRTSEMSGAESIDAVFAALPLVINKTHYGDLWLIRMACIPILLALYLLRKRQMHTVLFAALAGAVVSVICFCRSASGHAADFGDFSAPQLVDWLHLMAASFWSGPLLALAVVAPASVIGARPNLHAAVAGIADRYLWIFGPLLAIAVFSGMFNAHIEVGTFSGLLTNTYGLDLSAKLSVLLVIAMRFIAPPSRRQDEASFVAAFLKRIRIDALLILAILLCVAFFTHEIPARHLQMKHMEMNHEHMMMQ